VAHFQVARICTVFTTFGCSRASYSKRRLYVVYAIGAWVKYDTALSGVI